MIAIAALSIFANVVVVDITQRFAAGARIHDASAINAHFVIFALISFRPAVVDIGIEIDTANKIGSIAVSGVLISRNARILAFSCNARIRRLCDGIRNRMFGTLKVARAAMVFVRIV